MFVRYYVELPLPAGQVEHAMLDSPADWLSTVAGEAQRRGDHLLTEIGVGPLGPRLARRVTIQVGQPVQFPSMTSLPLTWEPVGLEGLLPRLDANLELGFLGEDRTQLAISARYRPPLGSSGEPSTECCCTGSPRPPSRTSWTGSVRRSPARPRPPTISQLPRPSRRMNRDAP
jgi:hypothetical protein